QPFGIHPNEAYVIRDPEHFCTLASHFERFLSQVDGSDLGSAAREIDGVGADAATDFQYFLTLPAIEFREAWDVGLNEIFADFHFIEIFARTHGLRRMRDI